jgi:rhamnulokinase
MSIHYHAAIDLGAESGRVMVGRLAEGKLGLFEIHRFPTGVTPVGETLRWEMDRIFDQIKVGLKKAAAEFPEIASVSADSWGVDYVYFSPEKPVLELPFHYRDSRTEGGFERAFARVSRDAIFAETGLQFMPFNSIFQWDDDRANRPELVAKADGVLLIADFINYLLSGRAVAEASLASTTQLYHPGRHEWSRSLIQGLGLEAIPLPEIVPSGTRLGLMRSELREELGVGEIEVLAGCSHDTGAAVAAVPGEGDDWAYLSSGTWSLLGLELPEPLLKPEVLDAGFTNEVGYGGSIRFLKNIVGLWIVQECRRAWEEKGESYSYDDLTRLAEEALPLQSWIDPRDERFAKPGDMPQKIAAFCRETGQPAPETPGAVIRTVLESLASLYRVVLADAERLSGRKIKRLHLVGGGSKNRLLNQLAANATGREVLAGPVEATAIGNVLIQALALGEIRSLAELRGVVRRSFDMERFQPESREKWEWAAQRFGQV